VEEWPILIPMAHMVELKAETTNKKAEPNE
jgi:hypothetical protein